MSFKTPGFWNYPQFNPYARGIPGATPPFVPTQGGPNMGTGMGGGMAPTSPMGKGPAWLQKFAGGMDKFMTGMAGGANPYLSAQEQQADMQRRKMAMISALIASSGPKPKNSQGLLAPFGAAMQAGQDAGDQFSSQALQQKLAQLRFGQAGQETLARQNVQSTFVGENGNIWIIRRDGNVEDTGQKASDSYQFMTGPGGEIIPANRRTGQAGDEIVTPDEAANRAANTAAAETGARTEAAATTEALTQARLSLPRIETQVGDAVRQINLLRNHPGREIATGGSRLFQTYRVPGTAGYDFETLRKQVQGGVFLEAYQSLKGGGQITEVEGRKAEEAKARMDAAQSEEAFLKALDDYEAALTRGLELARRAANGESSPSPMNGPGQGVINRGQTATQPTGGAVSWDDL